MKELKTYEKRIEPWVEKANIALKARPPSSFPDFLSLLNTIFRIEKVCITLLYIID